MAATNTLGRTVNLASVFIRKAPLLNVGGYPNEPGFSIGDWVRQFILAPPFAWRWNRNSVVFSTTPGQQDYVQNLNDFGWSEKASWQTGSTAAGELEIVLDLATDVTQGQPVSIAAVADDNDGNITFRLLPVPDEAYTITLDYQMAPPSFAAVTDTWSPVPDYLSYLYNQGFLAKTYEYWNDERFAVTMQVFFRQVIAANNGLDDSQKNIFLSERINSAREQSGLQGSQIARAGRGNFQ